MNFLFRFRYLLFSITVLVLLWGIFRPETPPQVFEHSDKWMHFIAFLGLSLVSRFAFCHKAVWLIWALLFVSAPALELLQDALQSSRYFSWGDALANLAGVTAAFLVWLLIPKHRIPK